MNLPNGRTAHLTFGIPPKLSQNSVSSISKHSHKAEVLKRAQLIIWDEAPMTHRHALELVDRLLQDLMDSELPFGGKVMVLGGDFRQVLPVVRGGTRPQIVNSCIVNSYCWHHFQVLHLSSNMRAAGDPEFQQFLLKVGNGTTPEDEFHRITLPDHMIIQGHDEDSSLNKLISFIFPELRDRYREDGYLMERAILCCKNKSVDKLNSKILDIIPGSEHNYTERTYTSHDSVEDDVHNLYQQEFLNSLFIPGFPPHSLSLKVGAPIIMLRNMDRTSGLCNGTRLIVENLGSNLIFAKIASGKNIGQTVGIPRIPLTSDPEETKSPFKLTRIQFPINLAFSITINKSQGQTIPNVGLFLQDPVFSHGQLYVALSRGRSSLSTKVVVAQDPNDHHSNKTPNIVYKEIFSQVNQP